MEPPNGPYIKRVYRPNGERIEEVRGVAGHACLKLTEPYDARIGAPDNVTMTDEANLSPQAVQVPAEAERERA